MEYEKLLDSAYGKIKKTVSGSRFVIPKVETRVEGNKTIVSNFSQICDVLRRDCEHLMKFLLKELAVAGNLVGKELVLARKIFNDRIDEKLGAYVKEFVLCGECGKPDTEIVKEDRLSFLHCLACGAKHNVRAKI